MLSSRVVVEGGLLGVCFRRLRKFGIEERRCWGI